MDACEHVDLRNIGTPIRTTQIMDKIVMTIDSAEVIVPQEFANYLHQQRPNRTKAGKTSTESRSGTMSGWSIRKIAGHAFQMSRLILASSSPRRIQLLREANFDPGVIPPEVTELSCDYLTPSELARFNARLKVATVTVRYPDAVVLGADTVVALGSEIFGKPWDLEDAGRMLGKLVGKTHEVITGVALFDANSGRLALQAVCSAVTFRFALNA